MPVGMVLVTHMLSLFMRRFSELPGLPSVQRCFFQLLFRRSQLSQHFLRLVVRLAKEVGMTHLRLQLTDSRPPAVRAAAAAVPVRAAGYSLV